MHLTGMFARFTNRCLVNWTISRESAAKCHFHLPLRCFKSPPLSFFLSLPDVPMHKAWGIYAIIYEKPGEVAKLYIGSGTGQ